MLEDENGNKFSLMKKREKRFKPDFLRSHEKMTFDDFQRKLVLNIYKQTFGFNRFFIIDYWKTKLKIKTVFNHPGTRNIKSTNDLDV